MIPSAKPLQPAVPRNDNELGEFLLRASHDLRGPLRSVRTYSELLLRDKANSQDSTQSSSLGYLVKGAVEVGALIDGLTDYSLALQIDPSSFLRVPMEVILRATLAKLADPLREAGAEVTYEKLPTVTANADRLMQFLEYLLDYALRNRGAQSLRVRITAEPQAGAWLFRMQDNGAGIEEEFLERIFKPFERVHGKERPGPGLATCRIIVERHGGTIWAESAPGNGCTFCFTLPESD